MSCLYRATSPFVRLLYFFFFFNDTATTEIYTLSLHDALPISAGAGGREPRLLVRRIASWLAAASSASECTPRSDRSEEHTSELQSPCNLVCRLLLEKKKKRKPSLSACTGQAHQSRRALDVALR